MKKRRSAAKSKSSSQPPPPKSDQNPATGESLAPQRISNSSQLSLREQLALARDAAAAVVDATEKQAKPRVRTKFRRKKTGYSALADVDRNDPRVRNGEWRRARGESDEADIPDGKYVLGLPPIALIDAYNIVGQWAKLAKLRNRGDMEGARDALVAEVSEFSSIRGWRCLVVFDANGNSDAVKEDSVAGVGVVFTGSETADSYIERRVFELCEQGDRQVWVATNDVAERHFAESKGAHCMSASLFIQEIKRAKKDSADDANARLAEEEASVAGQMLIRNVSEEAREKLYNLRARLDGNDSKSPS